MVKEAGAHEVFNHRDSKYLKKLEAQKFDIILEMLANVNLGNDLTLMNPRGRTIVCLWHEQPLNGMEFLYSIPQMTLTLYGVEQLEEKEKINN